MLHKESNEKDLCCSPDSAIYDENEETSEPYFIIRINSNLLIFIAFFVCLLLLVCCLMAILKRRKERRVHAQESYIVCHSCKFKNLPQLSVHRCKHDF